MTSELREFAKGAVFATGEAARILETVGEVRKSTKLVKKASIVSDPRITRISFALIAAPEPMSTLVGVSMLAASSLNAKRIDRILAGDLRNFRRVLKEVSESLW
jgi:hypothetical protein